MTLKSRLANKKSYKINVNDIMLQLPKLQTKDPETQRFGL